MAFRNGMVLIAALLVWAMPAEWAEAGIEIPLEKWTLSSDAGSLGVDEDWSLRVEGDGESSNHWRSPSLDMRASALYAVEFQAWTHEASGGTAVSGAAFCNRDLPNLGDDRQTFRNVFQTPARITPEARRLRFGQWMSRGETFFNAIRLYPAAAIYAKEGDIELGAHESIQDGVYRYDLTPSRIPTNHDRVLAEHDCFFNTYRWNFSPGSWVIYRHAIKDHAQRETALTISTDYYIGGELLVEYSLDGESWKALGRIDQKNMTEFDISPNILPSKEVWIRLHMEQPEEGGPAGMQVVSYRYEAVLEGAPPNMRGKTRYALIGAEDPQLEVEVTSFGAIVPGGDNVVQFIVHNTDEVIHSIVPAVTIQADDDTTPVRFSMESLRLDPGTHTLEIPYEIPFPGDFRIELILGGDSPYRAQLAATISLLHETRFGAMLPGATENAALWWAPSAWKISRHRLPPQGAKDEAMRISAAANEREAAQFVIRPEQPMHGLTIEWDSLVHRESGAIILRECIETLRVEYVPVEHPTDDLGARGLWPDPLPPLIEPLDLDAGMNYPFWVRVAVPKEIEAGIYTGALRLHAEDYDAEVPLEVEVYGFELPDRASVTTAFGFQPSLMYEYHGLETETDRRLVLEKYWQSFSENRISPYQPTPLDMFSVTWPETHDPETGEPVAPESLKPSIDWGAFDAALDRALNVYHFNSFRLPNVGMGGGTFYSRTEPSLLGFSEGSPHYQAAFMNYWQAVESHLEDTGVLDFAYIYWFDEPAPEDYPFVRAGFERLKSDAPRIPRMLTEAPTPELVSGPDIWCFLTNHYDRDAVEERRAAGERLWWYVCTVPKAPYAALFIDHPATALRAWLWQSWQRRIEGILVWQTNYWTSREAYPDEPQNPYQDPMGWVTHYGTPMGARIPWGNGDGRFIYPPEAAADGRPDEPVLEGPVSSIRWEMLRDGIEDYEYFVILQRLLDDFGPQLSEVEYERYMDLLETPADVSASMTHYTHCPEPILVHRHALARAIEALIMQRE